MLQRERDIVELIGQGKRRSEIGSMICIKYKCSSQSIERQYDKVLKKWIADNKDTNFINEVKATQITRLNDLYEQCYKNNQWKVASDIAEKIAKMSGVNSVVAEDEETAPVFNIVPRKVVPDDESSQ